MIFRVFTDWLDHATDILDGKIAITIAKPTIIKENGWYRHASVICPCDKEMHARVIPQPGQGTSVTV